MCVRKTARAGVAGLLIESRLASIGSVNETDRHGKAENVQYI